MQRFFVGVHYNLARKKGLELSRPFLTFNIFRLKEELIRFSTCPRNFGSTTGSALILFSRRKPYLHIINLEGLVNIPMAVW